MGPSRLSADADISVANSRGPSSQQGVKQYPLIDIKNENTDLESGRTSRAGEGSSQSSSVPSETPGSRRAERSPLFRRARAASQPVKGVWGKVLSWLKGPEPPQRQRIEPFFPKIQLLPVRLVDLLLPGTKRKLFALAAYIILWFSLFVYLLDRSDVSQTTSSAGTPLKLGCTNRLWDGLTCGLNGDVCRPFDNNTFQFCCPSSCGNQQVYNPYAVGTQEIIYRPLIIGGSSSDIQQPIYRGDSFICSAAVHSGFINDGTGGCGIVSMTGSHSHFPAVERNGINSVGFNATFPMSFSFLDSSEIDGDVSQATDPQWQMLALTVVFTSILSLATTSAPLFFATVFVMVFWQIGMGSNPPPGNTLPAVASTVISRFLPACFVAFIIYTTSVRRTLTNLHAQFEKTVLWLGACWVGALGNYTLDAIPIQRLTARDLSRQPGAIIALVIICAILLLAVLLQAWYLRLEGRLLRYLAIYGLIGVTLGLLSSIPGLDLRIHHYILGLLLLPGTALQTRPSLLFQGLLFGLFLEGVVRWDFAAILETPASLVQDGTLGSLLPILAVPIIQTANITFQWDQPAGGYDGVSVMVNDVERFRGFTDDNVTSYTWQRENDEEPTYFRFGYVAYGRIQGLRFADYTKAGVWEPGFNGSWTEMASGASK